MRPNCGHGRAQGKSGRSTIACRGIGYRRWIRSCRDEPPHTCCRLTPAFLIKKAFRPFNLLLYQLDAAVFGSSFFRGVVSDGFVLAMADGVQPRCGDPLLLQRRHHRTGAVQRQHLVGRRIAVESVFPSTLIVKAGLCFIMEATCSMIGPDSGLMVAFPVSKRIYRAMCPSAFSAWSISLAVTSWCSAAFSTMVSV